MRYVGRDSDNNVIIVADFPQPGMAEEALPANHPDIQAFERRLVPDVRDLPLSLVEIEQVLLTLGVTQAAIDAIKQARPRVR